MKNNLLKRTSAIGGDSNGNDPLSKLVLRCNTNAPCSQRSSYYQDTRFFLLLNFILLYFKYYQIKKYSFSLFTKSFAFLPFENLINTYNSRFVFVAKFLCLFFNSRRVKTKTFLFFLFIFLFFFFEIKFLFTIKKCEL